MLASIVTCMNYCGTPRMPSDQERKKSLFYNIRKTKLIDIDFLGMSNAFERKKTRRISEGDLQ